MVQLAPRSPSPTCRAALQHRQRPGDAAGDEDRPGQGYDNPRRADDDQLPDDGVNQLAHFAAQPLRIPGQLSPEAIQDAPDLGQARRGNAVVNPLRLCRLSLFQKALDVPGRGVELHVGTKELLKLAGQSRVLLLQALELIAG